MCVSLIALAVADTAVSQAAKIDPTWVYISQPLRWESPPRNLHLRIKTASAQVIILYPSGSLSEVGCLLIRQQDGKITISKGDGEVVKAGTWVSEGESIILTSHVVFRTVQLINPATGKAESESDVTEVFRKGPNSLQQVGKKRYVHLKTFDDFESLSALANEREGSDAKTK